MKDTQGAFEHALERLATERVPSDSRHARQLARRQLLAETVMAEGTMRIEDITERFGISLMTAHRDLDELVSRGLLRKTRGIKVVVANVTRGSDEMDDDLYRLLLLISHRVLVTS